MAESKLGGQKRKEQEYSDEKIVGISEYAITGFNPEENKEGKEITYLGESKDGNTTMRVAVQLKDEKTGKFQVLNFFLENKQVENKDKTKFQFINSVGRTMYADSADNLSEKFTAHPYHIARVGEAELVDLLNNWLDIDRKEDYSLEIDFDSLMKGSVAELRGLLKSDLTQDSKGNPRTLCVMATIRIVEKANDNGVMETKEYQQMYNRRVLSGYNMKYFRSGDFSPEKVEILREKDREASQTKKWLKPYEKFAVDVTDPQYGIKDIFYMGIAKTYIPSEYVAAGNQAHVVEDDTSY